MDSTSGPSSSRMYPEGENTNLDDIDLRSPAGASHAEAVQALRKYLLRKKSSEESFGDKELHYTSTERVISVAESNGSKLYCSLVQRPTSDPETTQGHKNCLVKHKSLDFDVTTLASAELRYLRTDLCELIFWSKCSFCDDFFENEENLRKHLRDSHFQYFSNYIQMRPLTSTKSLSDLPFSSALQIQDSQPSNSLSSIVFPENGRRKASVRCEVCKKDFTTKWNCKQHFKCHVKEGSMNDHCTRMVTDATSIFTPSSTN